MERRSVKNTGAGLNYAEQVPRRRAQDGAKEGNRKAAIDLGKLAREDMQELVHQLQVHQIELEMQNEELRRTQWQLDTARLRYFDLYDLAPVGYCTVGEHGMILEANLMAARLLGWDRSSLVKQPISRFIFKADQDIYYRHRKLLIESAEPQTCELRLLNIDNKPFWAELASTYEKDADGIAVLRMVMSDINDRREAAEARALLDQLLLNRNAELEHATKTAEKANLAKSDFLSSMSHELRTPLNAILGFAQILEGDAVSPAAQKRSVNQILQAGWYLLDLINEILDLALIESGKLSVSMESVSIDEVLRECRTMIEPQALAQRINLHFPETETLHYVNVDRTRLKQIIINLLSNAIKYNKTLGSVVVTCLRQSPERIRICVEDSGEGLSPEKISQLFQPFNRLGQESKGVEGTGIGLVMTKRLCELMGGRIGVESVVGKGSVFWIEINLTDKPTPTSDKDQAIATIETEVQTDTQHTIVYVEDNPANVMLVENIISRCSNLRLLTAKDANAGIQMAREVQPSVILMDINLSGINGIEAVKILALDPLTAHIPVVAVSANALPRDIEKCMELGFFRYLTKPFNINTLMSTIDDALAAATKTQI